MKLKAKISSTWLYAVRHGLASRFAISATLMLAGILLSIFLTDSPIGFAISAGIASASATDLLLTMFRAARHTARYNDLIAILGNDAVNQTMQILLPSFKLSCNARNAIENCDNLEQTEKKFPFEPEHRRYSGLVYQIHQAAALHDLLGSTYLVHSLAKMGVFLNTVFSATETQKQDHSFISFGLTGTDHSMDAICDKSNQLFKLHNGESFLRCRRSGRPLGDLDGSTGDFGYIIKVHPKQFNCRTWIVCGGVGSSGTSASSWLLANKASAITQSVPMNDPEGRPVDDRPFVAVVEQPNRTDESAEVHSVWLIDRPAYDEIAANPEAGVPTPGSSLGYRKPI